MSIDAWHNVFLITALIFTAIAIFVIPFVIVSIPKGERGDRLENLIVRLSWVVFFVLWGIVFLFWLRSTVLIVFNAIEGG